ncbi:MAG: urease accessory protein UreE [Granulosicoccus sp.]
MLIFDRHVADNSTPDFSVSLPYDKRVRGRLRIALDGGKGDAGINVERGELLREGSKLGSETGQILVVHAQAEQVSVAATDDRLLFARACYHIGNRHAQVQIDEQRLVYLHDHVLDEMLALLGLDVGAQDLPFEPENGAYTGAHAHAHAHAHDHDHDHDHDSYVQSAG